MSEPLDPESIRRLQRIARQAHRRRSDAERMAALHRQIADSPAMKAATEAIAKGLRDSGTFETITEAARLYISFTDQHRDTVTAIARAAGTYQGVVDDFAQRNPELMSRIAAARSEASTAEQTHTQTDDDEVEQLAEELADNEDFQHVVQAASGLVPAVKTEAGETNDDPPALNLAILIALIAAALGVSGALFLDANPRIEEVYNDMQTAGDLTGKAFWLLMGVVLYLGSGGEED